MSASIVLVATCVILLAVLGGWVIVTYNRFIRQGNMVREAWSGIDVQLKRRANLIPNLVETVAAYTRHEKGLLERLAGLRSASLGAVSVPEQGAVESQLATALNRLFAVAEAYPDLEADQNFRSLHDELSEIEDVIQMARRYYNGTVRELNVQIESFPSNVIAGLFGFTKAVYFEIAEPADRRVPEVSFS